MTGGDVIGLVPCAGHATRVAPLPGSKELFPVGLRELADGSQKVAVVSQLLLEKMAVGGVRRAFLLLRSGKWDIPAYYGDGSALGMDVGYLMMGRPFGPPYTVDQAHPFVRDSRVAFGFPDILLSPPDPFGAALRRLDEVGADVVVGLFRAHDTRVSDMVEVDADGRVRDVVIRPMETDLTWGWMFAVWGPRFTEFLHEYVAEPTPGLVAEPPAELTVGEVIQAAVRAKLHVSSVTFPDGRYLDIGTADGMRRVMAGVDTITLH
ncbi:MAG: Nucleotidyl transferase [Frankiales bacterium]|nr:Nucleotidyl transferase [Frankiales bacterium]